MNHAGITKPFHGPPVTNPAQQRRATVIWNDGITRDSVRDIKNNRVLKVDEGNRVQLTLAPGEIVILF